MFPSVGAGEADTCFLADLLAACCFADRAPIVWEMGGQGEKEQVDTLLDGVQNVCCHQKWLDKTFSIGSEIAGITALQVGLHSAPAWKVNHVRREGGICVC